LMIFVGGPAYFRPQHFKAARSIITSRRPSANRHRISRRPGTLTSCDLYRFFSLPPNVGTSTNTTPTVQLCFLANTTEFGWMPLWYLLGGPCCQILAPRLPPTLVTVPSYRHRGALCRSKPRNDPGLHDRPSLLYATRPSLDCVRDVLLPRAWSAPQLSRHVVTSGGRAAYRPLARPAAQIDVHRTTRPFALRKHWLGGNTQDASAPTRSDGGARGRTLVIGWRCARSAVRCGHRIARCSRCTASQGLRQARILSDRHNLGAV